MNSDTQNNKNHKTSIKNNQQHEHDDNNDMNGQRTDVSNDKDDSIQNTFLRG